MLFELGTKFVGGEVQEDKQRVGRAKDSLVSRR